MQLKILRESGEVLAVAIAYYVAARLALLLAIPPGYATAIWPAAGIALCALLFFGHRAAPGIFLGSFLANVGTSFDPTSADVLLRSILLPLGIGIGATLQGIVGATLIRRYVGFPTALDREADIVKFLILGGPVSCVISATIGVMSLLLTDTLPLHSYLVNWCIWWTGDTIGTLIVTPLALTWWAEPRDIWRRRRKTVALPLCVTFIVIVGVFIGARGELLAERHGLLLWAVLAAGLAFAGLLGAYLLIVSGHMVLIEQLAAARAIELDQRRLAEEALRDSEAQLRATFEQAAVGIAHLSRPDLRFLRVNPAFCRMTGYDAEELLAMTAAALTHPDDRPVSMAQYGLLLAGAKTSFTLEKRFIRKQGQVVWARVTVSAVRDMADRVLYVMKLIEDITQSKVSDQARKDTERRLELAVGIAQLGFWEWNVATNEVFWSPLFKKLLGYEDHELQSCYTEWKSRLHPEERSSVLDYVARYIELPLSEYELEYRLRHRDGSYHWFLTRAIPVPGENGKIAMLIGIHLDVTERKLDEERIREAALHDPLTGLPNRALVFEYASHQLAAARRNEQPAALLYIDLDRFKAVNDLYGHEIGDRLLVEITRRLRACVRHEDLVGRLGGDEFIVFLPNLDGEHRTEIVARHIIDAAAQPFQIDLHEMQVSLSIGISHFPKHGGDIDALVHAADVAMYQAKQSGRATYQFYLPEFDHRAEELLSIELALKRALNSDGLALYYQPIIDLKNGRAVGAEALLRLSGSGVACAGPQRFIPVAESAGLIGRLGEWVATEACRQHEEWISQGMPPLQISINVSPLQFRQGPFAERLTRIVADSGINPACLQIEVTESMVMENLDETIKTLQRIKELGIKVALDDFGTGYSSLSYLSTLPLDKLKVDQSFVKRIGHDRSSRAITKAILALGRTLKLEVIGEGIESEKASDYLRQHGCDQAQGYLFSRPLPADEFVNWFRMRAEQ